MKTSTLVVLISTAVVGFSTLAACSTPGQPVSSQSLTITETKVTATPTGPSVAPTHTNTPAPTARSADVETAPAPYPASSAIQPVTETLVIRYIPQVPSEERDGYCYLSNATPFGFRCYVGPSTFDPCHIAVDGETLVCDTSPMSERPGFRLKLDRPLESIPDISSGPIITQNVFLVELEDGEICWFKAWGTSLGTKDQRLNFHCGTRSDGLLGDLRIGTVWTAEKVVFDDKFVVVESDIVSIRTVWQ